MSEKVLPIILLAFANDREDGNAYLRNLTIEQRELRKVLAKLEDDQIAEVELLHGVTVNDVFDFFQHENRRGRVVIFHYAGHANSFQFLLEAEDGTNQSAHGDGILSFLAKQEGLRLAILNGCSTEGHALKLVESNVATVGTSTSIDDKVATDFAIRFYAALANKIPLKQAFDEAEDYVLTLKGSANLRTLYWEGANHEEIPNTVPWKLYEPQSWKTYTDWTIYHAYEALNITLAEKAREEWLKLGKEHTDPIERKTKVYLKNIRVLSAIKHLNKSFKEQQALQAYTTTLLQQCRVLEKQKKDLQRNPDIILSEKLDDDYAKLEHTLLTLMKDED